MNEDILQGQWQQLKGRVRQQWGKITNDDLDQIKGSRDVLKGKIQEYYGRTREQAEEELDRWLEAERMSYSERR
jgi:uncharacterized protein YjbJ (UPF0337 family)